MIPKSDLIRRLLLASLSPSEPRRCPIRPVWWWKVWWQLPALEQLFIYHGIVRAR